MKTLLVGRAAEGAFSRTDDVIPHSINTTDENIQHAPCAGSQGTWLAAVVSLSGLSIGYSRVLTWMLLGFLAPLAANAQDSASSTELWSYTIELRDLMRRYIFPEELLSYNIEFPGTFKDTSLRLREGNVMREFQLDDIACDASGNLRKATVRFRAGIGRGQTRLFVLDADGSSQQRFPDRAILADADVNMHTATLKVNHLRIRVPHGEFAPNLPLRDVLAPILKIARGEEKWIGRGSMIGDLVVENIHARPVADGNLRLIYRVEYKIAGNKRYTVDLTISHDETHVTVDEILEGFDADTAAFFKFSFREGLDPNGRLLVTNNGYNADSRWQFSGAFDAQLGPDGELPLQLGIWSPHSGTCVGAVTFWNDRPESTNALLFSRYRTHEWKAPLRAIWDSGNAPENIRWYSKDGDKYALARLVSGERHWAMAVIPVSESQPIAVESQDGSRSFYWRARIDMKDVIDGKIPQAGAGPEIRLYQKLTEFSLDWVKDLVLDWDEASDPPLPPRERALATVRTFQEYCQLNGIAGKQNWHLVEHYWGRHLGGATGLGRFQPEWFYDYAVSRKTWTSAQRREVRAIMVHWISSLMQRDGNQAHIAMISGHPNFIMDTLFAGVYCAVFPNHPDAPLWKASFLKMYTEWLKVYQREGEPENRALAGRWVESVACYSQAALLGLQRNTEGFLAYDGTDILKDRPRIADWLRWHMYALVTPMRPPAGYPYVFSPPIGAHAREALFALGRGGETDVPRATKWEFHGLLYDYARLLEASWPDLAAELKYCLTKGREGHNPHLESALFRDYGAILRHDFSGPHEAYVGVQQIGAQTYTLPGYRRSHSMNYRWSGSTNGTIYYAAKGQIWSWNDYEANGDRIEINRLPVFEVEGRALGVHATDGVLYNFGDVQFYRANGSNPAYRSRDVLLVGDDYLALRDRVVGNTSGKFHWVNPIGEMPAIHSVRNGPGDNLHVVEPRVEPGYAVAPTVFGAQLTKSGHTEYLCMTEAEVNFANGEFMFRGRTGYARQGVLALFEGQAISFGGFELEIVDGDFGASVKLGANVIQGRLAGRRGGRLRITPPREFSIAGKEVQVNGRPVPFQTDGKTFLFEVGISAGDGYKIFRIADSGARPDAPPPHPPLTLR